MDPNTQKDTQPVDEGEEAPLREEDVTLSDALDDRVPEGDGLADSE